MFDQVEIGGVGGSIRDRSDPSYGEPSLYTTAVYINALSYIKTYPSSNVANIGSTSTLRTLR
jgi:hypothetical protein